MHLIARSTLRGTVALALLAACGGTTQPAGTSPQITTINGVSYPILRPGAAIVVAGQGFAATQGGGSVLVTGASGTLLPCDVSSWSDVLIGATLPAGAESGRIVVARGADTLGPVPVLVRDTSAFDTSGTLWTAGPGLPDARADAAAAALVFPGSAATAAIVLTGGTAPDGSPSDTTYLTLATADGAPDSWTTLHDSTVPPPRRFATGAAADHSTADLTLIDGMAYAIGGIDSTGRFLPDVIGLAVSAAGQHVPWQEVGALPTPLAGTAAAVTRGQLIVAGGVGADSLASTSVYSATINPNGTLNGWFTGPSLPVPVAFASLVVRDTIIYLVGGETGHVDVDAPDTSATLATVYSIAVSPRSGYFVDSTWRAEPSALGRGRSRFAAFALDQGMLVTGGIYSGAPGSGESEFAPFAGTALGAFLDLTAPTLSTLGGSPLAHATGVLVADQRTAAHPTLLGGRTLADAPTASVWWH